MALSSLIKSVLPVAPGTVGPGVHVANLEVFELIYAKGNLFLTLLCMSTSRLFLSPYSIPVLTNVRMG